MINKNENCINTGVESGNNAKERSAGINVL
jgi:hypothetical protein